MLTAQMDLLECVVLLGNEAQPDLQGLVGVGAAQTFARLVLQDHQVPQGIKDTEATKERRVTQVFPDQRGHRELMGIRVSLVLLERLVLKDRQDLQDQRGRVVHLEKTVQLGKKGQMVGSDQPETRVNLGNRENVGKKGR